MLFRRLKARQRRLEELRDLDFDRFEWLCQLLKIKYIPIPEYKPKFLGKRATAIKEARDQFLARRRAKLQEFKDKLAKEKEIFLREKEVELSELEKELKEFGVEDTSSVEKILEGLNLGPPYVIKKAKHKTRRDLLLEKKFELYAHRRQETPT